MMAGLKSIAQRSVLTMQALGTLGVDPEWDALVTDLLRLDTLAHAEEEFGPTNKRWDSRALERAFAEDRYGKGWESHPEVRPMLDLHAAEAIADEELKYQRYYRPLWAAQIAVAMATPPTLAAALYKAALIELAEVWSDADMQGDCMEILRADLHKVCSPPA
jgi:hypothetical protein